MEADLWEMGERKQNLEGGQTRWAKVDGVGLKGGLKQRPVDCGTAEKPACSECGSTDRFNAQRPTWLERKKRWPNVIPTHGVKGGPKGGNPTD